MNELEIIKIVRSKGGGEWYPGPSLSKDFRDGWVEGWAMAVEGILDDLIEYFLGNMTSDEVKTRSDNSTIRRMNVVDHFNPNDHEPETTD